MDLFDKMFSCVDRKALIYKDKVYSYRNLIDNIYGFENAILSSVKPGQVVAIISDYSFYSITLFLILIKNKNIIVPITSTDENEINEKIRISCVEKVFRVEGVLMRLKKVKREIKKYTLIKRLNRLNNAGLILFSSGSTGIPKVMIHNLDKIVDSYIKNNNKNINSLIFLTFDHIGGIDTLFRLLSIGGTITIPEKRDPDYICSLIEKHKINVLPTTPTFLNLILLSRAHEKYDLSSLNIIAFGAEPMSEYLLKNVQETFPNVKLQQKYGTSETNAIKVISKSSGSLYIKIDDPNVEYKIEDNELWIKSKTQILGYLNANLKEHLKMGWFKTGDIVQTTEDGYFKFNGRIKEIINVGGEKVIPSETESVLMQFPLIKDCKVYAKENNITGQMVVADIVLKKGITFKDVRKELIIHCKEKLDKYKIPIIFNVIDKIQYTDRFKRKRL